MPQTWSEGSSGSPEVPQRWGHGVQGLLEDLRDEGKRKRGSWVPTEMGGQGEGGPGGPERQETRLHSVLGHHGWRGRKFRASQRTTQIRVQGVPGYDRDGGRGFRGPSGP